MCASAIRHFVLVIEMSVLRRIADRGPRYYGEVPSSLGEVGVGLQVAPNALSVLDALGVGIAAKKHVLRIERLLMTDAVIGEEVANIPCDERFEKRFGNPYAVAHRAHIMVRCLKPAVRTT
jgi:salicylate hydroxylase